VESTWAGAALATAAGVFVGLSFIPLKFMSRYRFEHWSSFNALNALVLMPWALALVLCPHLGDALRQLPFSAYLNANLCSLAWGIANVLCGLCLVRIGVSLTMGILTGVGLPIGILIPMVIKGSGQFADSPSLFSFTGLAVTGLTVVLVLSVALMAQAGFAREQAQTGGASSKRGGFTVGLCMAVASGVLETGLSFAFVYSQGPLMEALHARGAGETGAIAAVWAATLPGAALANVGFPLGVMIANRSWRAFLTLRDFVLTIIMAALFVVCLVCMGNGMRLMGALGASLGFGLYQGLQILSSQAVGVCSGEWRGAGRRSFNRMILAVILMLAAVTALAFVRSK
jgi:hypothetical protein